MPAAHLTRLLRGRWYRRLLAVRLTSQLGDGVLQVALASYALFSDDQPSAAAIATALALVTLPFSVLGPFAGVLLDRWSRRQVLVWANLSRVGIAATAAGVVAAGLPDAAFYAVVLVCLSVNRFLLAGLSAALPHTVDRGEDLVTANALTPTAGTGAFVVGLVVGGVVRTLTRGSGGDGEVAVLLTASILYGAAGALALRIPRPLLGPDPGPLPGPLPGGPGRAADAGGRGLPADLRAVVSGLPAGLRHLQSRRRAAAGLGVIASHRLWLGLASVGLVLLVRNGLHPGDEDAAFATLSRATIAGGAGFLVAALVTSAVVDRTGARAWVLALLVLAGAVQPLLATGAEAPLLGVAFALGLVSQGVKICVDTAVQADVDDGFRGRVFAVYDVAFNVLFVAGAAAAAAVLPLEGVSRPVLAATVAGYLLTAAGYARASRGWP